MLLSTPRAIASLLLLFQIHLFAAITPVFRWGQVIGGSGEEQARKVVVDKDENSYVAGTISSSNVWFGNNMATNPHGNQGDLFVAKFDRRARIFG